MFCCEMLVHSSRAAVATLSQFNSQRRSSFKRSYIFEKSFSNGFPSGNPSNFQNGVGAAIIWDECDHTSHIITHKLICLLHQHNRLGKMTNILTNLAVAVSDVTINLASIMLLKYSQEYQMCIHEQIQQ